MTASAVALRSRPVRSVQANYAGEPAIGAYSGPTLARHIQEAFAGIHVTDNVWIDGGIFYSHVGSESWATKDNLTYTRSLIAEYTPYYESGVRVTIQPSSKLTATLLAVNGWQIISENNEDKSFGARLDWTASSKLTLGYYNIIGNEQPDSAASRVRFLNGITAKLTLSSRLTVLATADLGKQNGAGTDEASTWWGAAVIGKFQSSERVGLSLRAEAYEDDDQVIIVTGGPAFRATGFSAGLDITPKAGVAWRSEFRTLNAKDEIFIDRVGLSKKNTLLVTSIAVTF